MIVKCDDVVVCELSANQKRVISNDIPMAALDADLKRRVKYILEHKYERCMARLRQEWEPKLKADGAASIPCDDKAFSDLVFARADYKDRAARDADSKLV